MPFARVTTYPTLPPHTAAQLAAAITQDLATVLGKKAAVTSVLVEGATGAWFIDSVATERAAHLEVAITKGTNTELQIEQFVGAAHAAMARHCGTLPEATYVVVRELNAGNWGYDGRTQAARKR